MGTVFVCVDALERDHDWSGEVIFTSTGEIETQRVLFGVQWCGRDEDCQIRHAVCVSKR